MLSLSELPLLSAGERNPTFIKVLSSHFLQLDTKVPSWAEAVMHLGEGRR